MHQNIFNPISLQIKKEENEILVLPMLSYTGSLQPAAQPLATSHWMMSAPLKKQSQTLNHTNIEPKTAASPVPRDGVRHS